MNISSGDSEQSKKEDEAELSHTSCGEENLALVPTDHTHNNCTTSEIVQSPDEGKTYALTQAEKVQASLGTKFPMFIRPLLKSNVSGGYTMGIPVQFCKSHLPEKNMEITLENEAREQFQTKYIVNNYRLSRGWRTFAFTQKLVKGDVAIFQLVEFNKFKVYIVRANNSNEDDEDLSLVNIDAHGQQKNTEKDCTLNCQKALTQNIRKRKRTKFLQSSKVQKKKKKDIGVSVTKTIPLSMILENNDKRTDLEFMTSPSSSSSQVGFKNVKCFKDFTIVVDTFCIDPELPDHIRAKYYALCSDKQSFLHDHLMQGLNSKLVAGIIYEIVMISDSVKKCSLTTCRDEFANWNQALKMFEFLGMNVGFLRSRVRKLEETCKKYDDDVKALKLRAERYNHKFREVVDAPW